MPYPYQPYTITQTLESADLSFKVPPGSRSKDIEVKWDKKSVLACVKHEPPTIKGEFFASVNIKSSIWQLEGNTVTLHIEKVEEDLWPYIIKPGPGIDPCSQFHIANALVEGSSDLPRSTTAAFDLYLQSADSGMEDAQMKVGYIYAGLLKDFDIPKNDTQAYTYFAMAANQHGNPAALMHVARAFHTGVGVEKNPKMAETFYQRAAAQQNEAAIYNLGVLYRSGPATHDFKPDPKKAFMCFQMAAELGSPDANHSLGIAYFGGDVAMVEGVDLYKARSYFEQAAKLSPEFEVPEQILEAIEEDEAEKEEEKEEEAEKLRQKRNETMGIAQEARESGKFGYMAGAVVFGLVAIFGFHWLATRN